MPRPIPWPDMAYAMECHNKLDAVAQKVCRDGLNQRAHDILEDAHAAEITQQALAFFLRFFFVICF